MAELEAMEARRASAALHKGPWRSTAKGMKENEGGIAAYLADLAVARLLAVESGEECEAT